MGPFVFFFFLVYLFACLGVLVMLIVFPFSVVSYVGFGFAYCLPFFCGPLHGFWFYFPFSVVHYSELSLTYW
jgi:hypothetical protein